MCFSQIYECHDPSSSNGVPKLKHTIKALEGFTNNQQSLNTRTKSHLRSVFMRYNELQEEDPSTFSGNNYTHVKTFSPIEFVAVAVLISQHGDRPNGMLRGDIKTIREYLRRRHIDLRMNESCWRTAWEVIGDLEGWRGAIDNTTIERTQNRAGRALQGETSNPDAVFQSPNNGAGQVDGPAAALDPQFPVNVQRIRSQNLRHAGWGPRNQKDAPSRSLALMRYDGASEDVPIHPNANRSRPSAAFSDVTIKQENSAPIPTQLDGLGHSRARSNSSLSSDSIIGICSPAPVATSKAPHTKRRAKLDLGTSSTGAKALAAKKARLMGKGGN